MMAHDGGHHLIVLLVGVVAFSVALLATLGKSETNFIFFLVWTNLNFDFVRDDTMLKAMMAFFG